MTNILLIILIVAVLALIVISLVKKPQSEDKNLVEITQNSLKVLDWIGETFAHGQVLVSLMRQYTPMPNAVAPLDRKITEEEYQAVLSWMYLNDLEGFTQEATAADTEFIPDF